MDENEILKRIPILQSVPGFLSLCQLLYNKNQEFRFIAKMELDEKLGNLEVGTAFPLKEIYEFRLKIYRQHLLAIQGSFGFISIPMLYTLLLLFLDFYTWGLSFIRDLYKYYPRYGLKFDDNELFFFSSWFFSTSCVNQLVAFFEFGPGKDKLYMPPGTIYLLPVLQSADTVKFSDPNNDPAPDISIEISLFRIHYKEFVCSDTDAKAVILYCYNNTEVLQKEFSSYSETLVEDDFILMFLTTRLFNFNHDALYILRTNGQNSFNNIRSLKKKGTGPDVDLYFNNYQFRASEREFLILTGISPYAEG